MIKLYSNFTEEARKVLINAKKEMYDLKHPYIGSEHLLLSILNNDNIVSQRLNDLDLTYEKLKKEIISVIGYGKEKNDLFLYTPLLKRVLETACINSRENNNGEVTISHLFAALIEEGEGIAIRIMLSMNIDVDELYNEFNNSNTIHKKKRKNKKLLLEELGVDITAKALENKLDPVIGREKEIKRILEILSRRTKNNPLLIGEAGVGKTAIVEELANMIVTDRVPNILKNKRIISLDMATAVAGTKYRGEFEERVSKILKECDENDDIILFIDEIHTLVGAGGAEGAIDASNIFKPALARGNLKCIGATTTSEYKKFIEKDAALARRFQKVNIEIPNDEMTKNILVKLKKIYEDFHHTIITDDIIDEIVSLSNKYIYDRNQPDKAIDVLDEVCAKVNLKENKINKKYNELNIELQKLLQKKSIALSKSDFINASNIKKEENKLLDEKNRLELQLCSQDKNIVTKEDVAEVINIKTKIPVFELLKENVKIIEKLNKNLKSRIIGQDKAIEQVINMAKKVKLGFKDKGCYSFLFVGPSGVGKTELAKIYGEILTGNNVIKLDMSEYEESHSISKIIGAPPGYVGYDDNKNVLESIKDNPYLTLILDEIEKANPSIINLFFQILDEGRIKDSNGNIVRFDNVTIIMTSNIGYDDNYVGFKEKTDSNVMSKLKDSFSIPFINRIDNTIVFNNLTKKDIIKLINIKLKNIINKYTNQRIIIDKNVINEICELSNYKEYGARKLDKIIDDKIENIIIDQIILSNNDINIKSISETSKV